MATQAGTVTAKQSNRRQWQRHKFSLPVRVLIVRKEKTSILNARGTDISEGGMALFAGAELRIQDQIFVEFTPPFSSEPVRVRVTVRSRHGYNYGAEFSCDNPEEEQTTARFRQLLRLASGTGARE